MKKLGFGCMRLPLLNKEDNSSIDFEQTCEMFDYFLENGFTYFDTAWMYHDFQSERFVKRCLVERHNRDEYALASKLPLWDCQCKEDQRKIFEQQLEKTGVDYFDYYMIHNLTRKSIDRCREFDSFNFLRDLKKEGKIKHFGFSCHDTPEFIDMILTENPDIDFVQLQINYLDWNHPRIASRRNYEVCVKHNKQVIIMEPVKGGALANVPEEAKEIFEKYDNGMSIASYAIRFCAELKNVIVILSGMSSLQQTIDNVSYMIDPKPLTDEENMVIQKVVDIMNKKELIQCTKCNYCLEGCPKNIAIPKYFELHNQLKLANGLNISEIKDEFDKIALTCGKPSDCINCKACEATCPQHLPITDYLGKINWMLDK